MQVKTMPIRPERKHLYPTNWKTEIVPVIQERSRDRCEICSVINGSHIERTFDAHHWRYVHDRTVSYDLAGKQQPLELPDDLFRTLFKIVLTVAHLNHDETDNRPENLAHLCQLHHNRHDAQHRAANAKARREREVNK
jgi:hypothetical protein